MYSIFLNLFLLKLLFFYFLRNIFLFGRIFFFLFEIFFTFSNIFFLFEIFFTFSNIILFSSRNFFWIIIFLFSSELKNIFYSLGGFFRTLHFYCLRKRFSIFLSSNIFEKKNFMDYHSIIIVKNIYIVVYFYSIKFEYFN